MSLTFEISVCTIEDGMLEALTVGMTGLGVQDFDTYSGELDATNLQAGLMGFAKKCPRIMVAYMNGRDVQDPATSTGTGRPLHFRHDCTFAVIAASNDARGENVRRLGVYKLLSKAGEILAGKHIRAAVDSQNVAVTSLPLMPGPVKFLTRMANMTAYARVFGTSFRWSSPDRTTEGETGATVVVNVESLMEHSTATPDKPGVKFTGVNQ